MGQKFGNSKWNQQKIEFEKEIEHLNKILKLLFLALLILKSDSKFISNIGIYTTISFGDSKEYFFKKILINIFYKQQFYFNLQLFSTKNDVQDQDYEITLNETQYAEFQTLIDNYNFILQQNNNKYQSNYKISKSGHQEAMIAKLENSLVDNLCAVCLNKKIEIILPCMHGFCQECCCEWIVERQKNSCPLCRGEYKISESKLLKSCFHFEDSSVLLSEMKEMIWAFLEQFSVVQANKKKLL